MKRLVTQFDDTRTKATVATPTCSSCCCCCCCVATILTTSSVTAMNVRDLAKDNNVTSGSAAGYKVLGFLAFPIAIALGIVSAFILNSIFAIAVVFVAWMLMLKFIYKKTGLHEPSKIIGTTVGIGVAFFIGELVAGGSLLMLLGFVLLDSRDSLGIGVIVYLLLAIILPFLLVPSLRNLTRPLLANAGSITMPVSATTQEPSVSPTPEPNEQNNTPSASDGENKQ